MSKIPQKDYVSARFYTVLEFSKHVSNTIWRISRRRPVISEMTRWYICWHDVLSWELRSSTDPPHFWQFWTSIWESKIKFTTVSSLGLSYFAGIHAENVSVSECFCFWFQKKTGILRSPLVEDIVRPIYVCFPFEKIDDLDIKNIWKTGKLIFPHLWIHKMRLFCDFQFGRQHPEWGASLFWCEDLVKHTCQLAIFYHFYHLV